MRPAPHTCLVRIITLWLRHGPPQRARFAQRKMAALHWIVWRNGRSSAVWLLCCVLLACSRREILTYCVVSLSSNVVCSSVLAPPNTLSAEAPSCRLCSSGSPQLQIVLAAIRRLMISPTCDTYSTIAAVGQQVLRRPVSVKCREQLVVDASSDHTVDVHPMSAAGLDGSVTDLNFKYQHAVSKLYTTVL
jgi:hypothetical protein